MIAKVSIALAFASQICGTFAWGDLGHETIAYIAQNFVKSSTESWAKDILGDSSTSYLASVATWADSYRYTSEGSFSYPYHFIDAQDNPPETCNVDYERDCGDSGCSIKAIDTYTNTLLKSSKSDSSTLDALKFIIHFVGDIHQPLHDENLDVGGNDIDVTFGSTSTNLHHIWDTNMLEEYAGGYSLTIAKKWAKTLTTSIESGAYSSDASSWLKGLDVSNPIDSATTWASDANSYVCSVVLKPGIDYLKETDLSGSYYKTCTPVFEELLARAGYRLAAWLDTIADQASS